MRVGFLLYVLIAGSAFGQTGAKPLRTTGTIDFQRTPITAVADYMAMLGHKPVLVGWEANCPVTFYSKSLVIDEASPVLAAAIESNGCRTLETASWIKIVPKTQTEPSPDAPHVEVRIEEGQLTVGNVLMDLDRVADFVSGLQPAIELWLLDLDYPPARTATDVSPERVVAALDRFDRARIFRVHERRPANAKPAAEVVVAGQPNIKFVLRTVDRLGRQSGVSTVSGREPTRCRAPVEYVSCELERVGGSGTLTLEVFQKTNLVVSGTLPGGKHLLRIQKAISGWTHEEY